MPIYRSLYSTIIVGSTKGKSLSTVVIVGSFKGKSIFSATSIGSFKAVSETIKIQTGQTFINWSYDSDTKQAIGTLEYPLYNNANFSLSISSDIKTPDNKSISNPQIIDYST
jgi:hypothetical protein